jgi:hypothetical protein
LTDEAIALLEDFALDCTDRTGRTVSVSAVVRALALYAGTQVRIVHKLTSLIEAAEISLGETPRDAAPIAQQAFCKLEQAGARGYLQP